MGIARLRGCAVVRERLFIPWCSDSHVIIYMAGINVTSQEVFSACRPFGVIV